MIQAAIFDMDGLMYDTEPLWYKAWTPALARFGLTFDEGVAIDCRGTSGTYRDAVIARHYPGQDAHGIGVALDADQAAAAHRAHQTAAARAVAADGRPLLGALELPLTKGVHRERGGLTGQLVGDRARERRGRGLE